jgi:UDP-N-acetylglucosamine 2-epimerase (non-hydrolysing)/GDP/UDP-N,N'-diacetylbacillosamine 2-epimerase (hydrolysing)
MSPRKRVVAVFTGNRAEYGLQFPILKAIAAHPGLEYKLIVSGAHLDRNFGRTLSEIRKDWERHFDEIENLTQEYISQPSLE